MKRKTEFLIDVCNGIVWDIEENVSISLWGNWIIYILDFMDERAKKGKQLLAWETEIEKIKEAIGGRLSEKQWDQGFMPWFWKG